MADEKDASMSDGETLPAGDSNHETEAETAELPGYQPPEAALPASPVDPETAQGLPDDSVAARVERAIAAWMEQHIHNSPVSRDTAVVNHLTGKLADLRRMICEGIG